MTKTFLIYDHTPNSEVSEKDASETDDEPKIQFGVNYRRKFWWLKYLP